MNKLLLDLIIDRLSRRHNSNCNAYRNLTCSCGLQEELDALRDAIETSRVTL
jgi:hypothetical protein